MYMMDILRKQLDKLIDDGKYKIVFDEKESVDRYVKVQRAKL